MGLCGRLAAVLLRLPHHSSPCSLFTSCCSFNHQTSFCSWHLQDIDFVPESMSAMNALKLMRQRRLHMVVVVDEYGGTSGEQPTLHTEILTGP